MVSILSLMLLIFSGNTEAGELWTKYQLPDAVNCIISYGDYVWTGTNKGLIRINRIDGTKKNYISHNGFPSYKITSINVDKNGLLFVGLIDIQNDENGNTNSYLISLNDKDETNNLTEVSELRNEIFYLNGHRTYEKIEFIDIFDNNYYFAVNSTLYPGDNSSKYMIAVIKFDGTNWNIAYTRFLLSIGTAEMLWIYNMYLNPYNPFNPFTLITDNSQGKLKDRVYDRAGEWNIYFDSSRADFIAWSDTTRFTPENSGLTGNVNVMAIDSTYTKWFGCNNKTSLVSYDNILWKSYTHTDWNDGTIIKLLNIDEDNNVWVVTSNPSGLYRLNPNADTSVESENQTPAEFTLSAAYPNPFNAQTTISFTLTKQSKVNLSIYSLTGQKVRDLAAGNYTAGKHTTVWDGKNENDEMVSSGLYLARMESGGASKVVRMAMVK